MVIAKLPSPLCPISNGYLIILLNKCTLKKSILFVLVRSCLHTHTHAHTQTHTHTHTHPRDRERETERERQRERERD